ACFHIRSHFGSSLSASHISPPVNLQGLNPPYAERVSVSCMKVVLLIVTVLIPHLGKAVRLVPSEREEPCANTIDVSISHGNAERMNNSTIPLVSNLNLAGTKDITLTIFWTVGPGVHAQDVIDDQVMALRASKLIERVSAIYVWGQDYDKGETTPGRTHADLFAKYGDIREKLHNVTLPSKSAEEFWRRQDHTYEFPTLEGLWTSCRAEYMRGRDANNFVLYMHSKGSTKYKWEWVQDSKWRSTMQHFVLHRYADCVEHLRNGFATCGALLEKRSDGATWPHYRGNFWWARCDYIKQLPNPRPEDFQLYIAGNPFKPKPSGRFLAEWWLLGSNALHAALETSHKNCWGQPSQFARGGQYDNASPESCAVVGRSLGRCV
ncbi:unnamed protein product, partial [Prorocentrum cordatum]